MNVQDAKNLTIPEGGVKMIHDKDNRLLWGAVGYDAKYSGDTTQETTTGKNLVDFANISYSSANSGTATRDGATYTVTAVSQSFSGIQFVQTNLHLQPDTTYTFSAKVVSTTATNGSSVYAMAAISSTGSNIGGNLAKAGEISSVTFTTPSSISGTASIRLYARTSGATAVFTDIQLEKGPSATNWEKYTGGIPAPNPDYPEPVNLVTGEQTVTISDDGNNTQTFTVDLGATELCKIGNYQDYIYKSGSDWYIHKETGVTTDTIGSTDITITGMVSNGGIYSYCGGTVNGTIVTYTSALVAANTIYYQLVTPTDTKITDATLISQLNVIHQWLTRYGYNATVTGNLPLIINRTNL